MSPKLILAAGLLLLAACSADERPVAARDGITRVEPPFWWIWGSICLYMFATSFLLSNATALALDPVPEIAGVAASIIGTATGSCSMVVASLTLNSEISVLRSAVR